MCVNGRERKRLISWEEREGEREREREREREPCLNEEREKEREVIQALFEGLSTKQT